MKDFVCIDLKGVAKPWPQKNMYISHTQIQIEMMAIKLKTHKHNNIMCAQFKTHRHTHKSLFTPDSEWY